MKKCWNIQLCKDKIRNENKGGMQWPFGTYLDQNRLPIKAKNTVKKKKTCRKTKENMDTMTGNNSVITEIRYSKTTIITNIEDMLLG